MVVLQLKRNASKRAHLMSLSFQLVGISCLSVVAICRWNTSMMMRLSATCQKVNNCRLIFCWITEAQSMWTCTQTWHINI